jgi:hypothetical protein
MLTIKYRKIKKGRKTIDAILSHNGYRIELSTGVKLPAGVEFIIPRAFSGGTLSQRSQCDQDLHEWESVIRNKYSDIVSTHGHNFHAEIFSAGMKATSGMFKGEAPDDRTTLSGFASQFYDKINSGHLTKKSDGRAYASRSISVMLGVVSIIEKFVIKHGDFDFSKYNDNTAAAVGKSAVSKAYNDLCENIKAYLITECGYGQYTVSNTLSTISLIINERAEYHGINISDRYLSKLKYKIRKENVVVALSSEQFEWLMDNEDLVRGDCKLKSERIWVDYMYAGLLTAARLGDLGGFNMSNLIKSNDGYMLSYIPMKTKNSSGVKVEMPVVDRLLSIFLRNAEKYNGKLLPVYRHQKAAPPAVRAILAKYEIFHNYVQYLDTEGNIASGRLCDVFVFHSTRASLITYLLSKGEQETVIKSVSGHTLDSSSFKVYASITASAKVRVMQRVAFGIK